MRYLFFLLIFKNISGFAIKHLTDCRKGGKADSRDLVIFDLGEINVGDSYALGKLVQRDLSLYHHSVESEYYFSHFVTSQRSPSTSFSSSMPCAKN